MERCPSCANVVPTGAGSCAICRYDFGRKRVIECAVRIPALVFLLGIVAEVLWVVTYVFLGRGNLPEGGPSVMAGAVFFVVATLPVLVLWVLAPIAAFAGTANLHYLVVILSGVAFYTAPVAAWTVENAWPLLVSPLVPPAVFWVILPVATFSVRRLWRRPS